MEGDELRDAGLMVQKWEFKVGRGCYGSYIVQALTVGRYGGVDMLFAFRVEEDSNLRCTAILGACSAS